MHEIVYISPIEYIPPKLDSNRDDTASLFLIDRYDKLSVADGRGQTPFVSVNLIITWARAGRAGGGGGVVV